MQSSLPAATQSQALAVRNRRPINVESPPHPHQEYHAARHGITEIPEATPPIVHRAPATIFKKWSRCHVRLSSAYLGLKSLTISQLVYFVTQHAFDFSSPLLAKKPVYPLALLLLLTAVLANAAYDLNVLLKLAQQRYEPVAVQTVRDWDVLVQQGESLGEMEKLHRVNNFFNRHIVFTDDLVVWKQIDYWATPLESMGHAAGDCEDYAIAKYVTLKQMQVPIEKLRLTYVRAQIGGPYSTVQQAHMVLSYYPRSNAEPFILDNLISDIRPASRRPDLFPVFSFNSTGLWVGGTPNPVASSTARLSRWRDVLMRMRQEGID